MNSSEISYLNNSATSMELSQPMDVSSDEERTRNKIFVLTCPFCNDEFVIPIVFISHLSGHIAFHSDRNLFKCNICDRIDHSLTFMAIHVEKHHSVKKSIQLESAEAKQLTDRNVTEKENMISILGKCDDASRNFWLPY